MSKREIFGGSGRPEADNPEAITTAETALPRAADLSPQHDTMPRRPHLVSIAITAMALAGLITGVRDVGQAPAATHNAMGRGVTIALVHGLGSRPEHWFLTARHLARDHRVVLISLPGHGSSEMLEPFSLERAVESLDAALAGEGPVVLVGHSIGGLVATAEALAHPERVRALVLVETALRPQVGPDERAAILGALDSDYRGLLRAVYTSFGRDSAQGIELYDEAAALDSTAIKPWIRLAISADLSVPVEQLKMPVLAVLAERSWPIGEAWRATADTLGYSRIPVLQPLRIEGCGHFVMLDRPVDLAEAIARFAAHPDGEPIARR